MASYRLHGAALASALVLTAGGAAGQGIPVIDQTAILKHIGVGTRFVQNPALRSNGP